ncbi:MAG TPA: DnaJ C-terminal domain-containing protein [Aliidongia sp.]|uniref:DnaJ C-terminal domain-containing protein n=1 Tax=Aliidongia sp. TaxID=1914230 RepID=UPI002DDCEFB4|nr:DnaJ C-terminal domain-containing protein [Aliidongia sp.]HEV2673098.1 DnaJ C-terminal domain-containing protein [Aliidongia sp.]
MKDPYKLLGVERGADDKAIQKAYRKLAKLHHPDLNPDKPEAEATFKDISAAYTLLSDPEKRGRFDRGEIDAEGTEQGAARNFYRDFGDRPGSGKYQSGPAFGDEDLESLLRNAFGRRPRGGFAMRGADMHYTLSVDFVDAAKGTVKRLTLPDGATLDVTIPAGLKDGQVLRLKGKGQASPSGGAAGDALIEISVMPHPFFRRDGNDVIIDLPVTVQEAVMGAKIRVPTIEGPVTLTIQPRSNSGTRMRLKGRGIAGGHQFVDLRVVIPTAAEPELEAFLATWQPQHPVDPRSAMEVP